ncbi:MAG: response regulator transcription factor [Gemmatimonadales bacterium]
MSGDPAHVLIVEDNDLVSGALRVVFESAGYRVSTAASLAEASALVAADPAALVLLDLTLPDGDGLGLVAAARQSGARAVVALTGRDDDGTRQRCLDAGCAGVMLKPVPVRELLRLAEAWLEM